MPIGVVRGQDLEIFPYFDLMSPGASVFHKHMSTFNFDIIILCLFWIFAWCSFFDHSLVMPITNKIKQSNRSEVRDTFLKIAAVYGRLYFR